MAPGRHKQRRIPRARAEQSSGPVGRRTLVDGAAALVAAGAAGVLAAACGPLRVGQSEPATRTPATLSYLSPNSGVRVQRLRQVFDAFTAEQPQIRVEVGTAPEGQTPMAVILVRHQSGDPADVFEWPTYWHGFHAAGATVDLTAHFKRGRIEPSTFVPEHIANLTVAGKLYGLPVSISADAFAYNLDLLHQAGVPAPPANPEDKSWTMERFLEAARKLTRPGEQWGFGGRHSGGGGFYHDATFFGAGPWHEKARRMTVDTPAFRRGLEFWRDLDLQFRAQPTAAEARQLVGPGQDVFLSGKVAFQNLYVGLKPEFRWGLATLPSSGPARNVAGRLGLHSLFLGPGKQQEAAWTFVTWFARPRAGGAYVWALGHAVSPQLDATASESPQQVWKDTYGVDPKALLLQSRSSKRARWGLSTLRGWDEADREIQALYRRFRAGEIATDELVRESHRLGTAAIAASK